MMLLSPHALAALHSDFSGGDPFPHIVIDGFLTSQAAEDLLAHFPSLGWRSYHHYNERKRGMPDRAAMPPAVGAVIDALNGPEFLGWLEKLSGIKNLIADPDLDGGGLHESGDGGFLNLHVDFLAHNLRPTWRRRVNLILFLNKDWREEYGGALELWNADMTACVKSIAPVFNRAVLFETREKSWHGHPTPMRLPPGVTRKSVALYYFTDEGRPLSVASTHYRARPQDSRLKRSLIVLDRLAVRIFSWLKRKGLSEVWISRLLAKLSRKP